ncbi:MAG: putative TIM-barrel fold metal-dependent hydrolase [Pseudoalteromonas tetraodonis]|jgi:predicted TIM-barrel fold metal-dependent hydrolase
MIVELMMHQADQKRRKFLKASGMAAIAASLKPAILSGVGKQESIIDIHQHVHYLQRDNQSFLKHQDNMGISKTVLLPAGRIIDRASTHAGKSNGLAALIHGNEAAMRLVKQHPTKFATFANEVPDVDGAVAEIEKYLKLGAIGIGELKFNLDVDSAPMREIFSLASDHQVPVLIHFQDGMYNHGLDRFHKVLEKFPRVNFIGHAQTWWGNIDKAHEQKVLYPKGKVVPGGISDRLLSDYPNMFGDLSAGSGQNALKRDLDHAQGFIERHQDKLMFGSDCPDKVGAGDTCTGTGTLTLIKKLASDLDAWRKIVRLNAMRVMKLE